MYVPTEFSAENPDLAWLIVEENPFGVLVHGQEPNVAHLPFIIAREPGPSSRLRAHIARRNPAAERLDGARVTAIFRGPDTYVTPLWYAKPEREVPTWNYVVAQVWGTASLLDKDGTRALLDDMCVRFEEPGGYRLTRIAQPFLERLLEEIVGFEVRVEQILGKCKLSQNKSATDQRRVMDGLTNRATGRDAEVLAWMRRVYG